MRIAWNIAKYIDVSKPSSSEGTEPVIEDRNSSERLKCKFNRIEFIVEGIVHTFRGKNNSAPIIFRIDYSRFRHRICDRSEAKCALSVGNFLYQQFKRSIETDISCDSRFTSQVGQIIRNNIFWKNENVPSLVSQLLENSMKLLFARNLLSYRFGNVEISRYSYFEEMAFEIHCAFVTILIHQRTKM